MRVLISFLLLFLVFGCVAQPVSEVNITEEKTQESVDNVDDIDASLEDTGVDDIADVDEVLKDW